MDRFQGLLGVVAIFGVAIAASTDRRAISLRTIGLAFAFQVLPVIVFSGALVGLLYYLRVIQLFVDLVGGAIARVLGTSKVESVFASTVIFRGQTEAPLGWRPTSSA